VQTQNGSKKASKAEKGDSITFTFAGAVTPSLILAGWDGSATAVTVHFQNNKKNDVLTVRNASTAAQLTALGSVQLNGDYSNTADFSASTLTASGNTVTIVLGTLTGSVKENPKPAAMVWTTLGGPATESGSLDTEF
jgi:chitinase